MMEENTNTPIEPKNDAESEKGGPVRGPWTAVIVLLCLTVAGGAYVIQQRRSADELSAKNQELTSSLTETKGQVDALATKLNQMQAEEQAREQAAAEAAARRAAAIRHHLRAHHVPKDDPRWQQVQAELANQQKSIDSTQQDLAKTRSDLQNSLSSARDELNGSIAKTHDELVALEQKGERNYYEFDVNKSKQFSRVGPINISLRKTNEKHQYCDLNLLVDDKNLSKKHVNLYEPVVFYTDRAGQPVELVINQISKNHMHGYVSAPKYKATDLAASAAARPASNPAPTTVDALQHRP